MRRLAGLSLAALLVSTTASAQIVQSVHFGGGLFFPRGFDSRDAADTLVRDLIVEPVLTFNIDWFKSGQFFGEWNLETGNHLQFGVGASFYRSTDVFSHYLNPPNGQSAGQVLHLRLMPVMAVVRYFPFGNRETVQPFIGAGTGVCLWKYSESGSFIDTSDSSAFNATFAAEGRARTNAVLFGIRIPVATAAFNIEWRYQYGLGKTGGAQAGFLGDKIDLGGGSLMFGLLARF